MSDIVSFADVAQPIVSFSRKIPSDALVLKLIDTQWFQRLRDISQTANTRLVYMFSEHSRFGHSIGVAYLAKILLESLEENHSHQIEPYRSAIQVAALLHDIGHIAPGSHTAYTTWFPSGNDAHEEIGCNIIQEDQEIRAILEDCDPNLPRLVTQILREDAVLPSWTWEIISGGAWNVDRGNWCVVDSVLAGVSYGQYNIPALVGSLHISTDGRLTIKENRLDALMHFSLSRHAMYRQIYQHRTLMAADMLNVAIAMRLRAISESSYFADPVMQEVLSAKDPLELSLPTIFQMREGWWRYHLLQWQKSSDTILADLARRLLNRRLLKTVRILPEEDKDELLKKATEAVQNSGYDPKYYLHNFRLSHMHRSDSKHSLKVQQDDGKLMSLGSAEPLFEQLVAETDAPVREWIALPAEAKSKLGRVR
jgi:HD superfamily phosphohydrolase